MTVSGVYQIMCVVTGARYVGSSIDVFGRWRDHRAALLAGRHVNPKFQAVFAKYGERNFKLEVLEEAEPSALLSAEQRWLDSERPELNISLSAEAPMRGRRHSEESRGLISASKRAAARAMTSAEKQNLREHWKGRVFSTEHRAKISAAKRGRKMRPEHVEALRELKTGLRWSLKHGRFVK